MHRPAGAARAGERGQALVLVALFLTSLLGMAAVAVDVGRFYTERRFLQNSADSAALAAANALILGHTQAEAEAEARALLARNALDDPTGSPPALPSAVPLYADGHAGEGAYLVEGILFSGGEVRVALRNPVGYTFGRVVGLTQQEIGARARAGFSGGLLPIAVRHYVNMPGPNANPGSPCANDQTQFLDFFATENTACLGTDSDPSGRTAPSAGANFDSANPDNDPANHGPVVTILGQGAQPANGVSFRGFINLDTRNFATTSSQVYYNGVTAGTNSNTLKQKEASWITAGGYPPPYPPPPTTPPDPNDQVGVIDGNSTGIAIDEMARRFGPGDEILVAVYPGSVMAIPDFSLSPPGTVALPTSGLTANAGSLKVSRNQAFSGQVTLSTLPDTLDPANPMVLGTLTGGATPITYDPSPVTPSLGNGASVALTNMTTSGAAEGIYIVWVQGQAGSPYLTTKHEPFAVKIGTVTRDFTITSDASSKDAANVGDTVSFTLTLQNSPNKNTAFGNAVTLSVDGPLPAGAGPVTFGSTSVTPSKNGTNTTLSINTGTMAQGSYRFIVRATGMNGDSPARKVTHLLALTVAVAPAGASGSDSYVDIVGFALMRITLVTANNVDAYAITPVITDLNDQALRRGQTARLLPWD